MNRTEFLKAFCDFWHPRRPPELKAKSEAETHALEREAAAVIWRRNKARLQMLTADEWRKQQEKRHDTD